jgi:hypothetical protein
VRLICGPIAGRVADRFQLFRAELAACAIVAEARRSFISQSTGFGR